MMELEEKYRQYVIARMRECIQDAKAIFESEFGSAEKAEFDRIAIIMIANSIFDKRISPFHYWKDKKIMEGMK